MCILDNENCRFTSREQKGSEMIFLTNAFSIQMLEETQSLCFAQVTVSDVQIAITDTDQIVENTIGHSDTNNLVSQILSQDLGNDIPYIGMGSRKSVTLGERDTLIVAQYKGPRLPEGATQLPEGAAIQFWMVYKI